MDSWPTNVLLCFKISHLEHVQAELARIALTSLSSLSVQRSLHRDRAHESAVAFSDVGHTNGTKEPEALEQLTFLTEGKKVTPAPSLPEETARDPRAALEAIPQPSLDDELLLPVEISKLQLPQELRAKDAGLSDLTTICKTDEAIARTRKGPTAQIVRGGLRELAKTPILTMGPSDLVGLLNAVDMCDCQRPG